MKVVRAFLSVARPAVILTALASAPVVASAQPVTMTSSPVANDPGARPSAVRPVSTVLLDIRNGGVLDAVVYAYRMGQRYRLGLVVAQTTVTLTLPLNCTEDGETQLLVHRVGERPDNDFLSNVVRVGSGMRPMLFVEHDLQTSSLAAFPDRQ